MTDTKLPTCLSSKRSVAAPIEPPPPPESGASAPGLLAIPTAHAPLPATYEKAKATLAACVRIDECKDWHDKAAALASYAKQAKDDELRQMAVRIQARAIHRAGELLKEIEPGQGARDGKRQEGDLPPLTRTQAAENAGLSEHQRKTALRIAGLSREEFESAIESFSPPTITELAERGTARKGITTGVAMDPYAEREPDLYETPETATRALLAVESFSGPIWEPAYGRGAIVRVLRQAGHQVIATDLVDRGFPDSIGGVDFLTERCAPKGVQTVITNPPYMHADDFVRHALALVPRVVMLLRLLFVEGVGRTDILEGGRLARIHVFRERIQTHRDGWEGPRNSNPMALAWYVWEQAHKGPPEVHRISPVEAPYDGERDFSESINDCYRAARKRVAEGGPGWTPKPAAPQSEPAVAGPQPEAAANGGAAPDNTLVLPAHLWSARI
jgi:hypothetical protein